MSIAMLDEIMKHYGVEAEVGYNYTLKAVGADLRTRNDYQWKIGINKQKGQSTGAACGTGLHLGKTWGGMSSGGHGVNNLLLVRYQDEDILDQDDDKVRVSRCRAVCQVAGWKAIVRFGEKANLSEADLSGANLSGANLSGANLSEADLFGADLSWANLSRAKLSGAYLSGADLSCANLSRAQLAGANLSGANLSMASLWKVDLYGAKLAGAKGLAG